METITWRLEHQVPPSYSKWYKVADYDDEAEAEQAYATKTAFATVMQSGVRYQLVRITRTVMIRA